MTDPVPLLERVNEARASGGGLATEEADLDARFACSAKLAVYGSLAPGESNHAVVESLGGTWRAGSVRGRLHRTGWGARHGYPGLVWDPTAPAVPVRLLESEGLRAEWARIDDFEGPDYLRILVPVELEGGEVVIANLYAIRRPPGTPGAGVPPR